MVLTCPTHPANIEGNWSHVAGQLPVVTFINCFDQATWDGTNTTLLSGAQVAAEQEKPIAIVTADNAVSNV